MVYNKVYEAIYKYISSIVENFETDFNTDINIETVSIDDFVGLLIQKIGNKPTINNYIDGSSELLFTMSIKSYQYYNKDDNENTIKITQFLDNLCQKVIEEFKAGNIPLIDDDSYRFEGIEQLNTSTILEYMNDKAIAYVDIQFNYYKKRSKIQ